MAVARKAEFKRELCDVVAMAQLVKRTDQPKMELVLVKRDSFRAREFVRKVNRGNPHGPRYALERNPFAAVRMQELLGARDGSA